MPLSAIATGAIDVVAAVEAMPNRIMAIQDARQKSDNLASLSLEKADAARLAICAILNRTVGHDFSGYKDKTFLRRVQRRMQVLGLTSLDAFIKRLEDDRHEVIMLFRDLLIGVTSFFRDEETFGVLQHTVIPRLFERKSPDMTIRIWVPGCATGEEAYSLAILMREQLDRHDESTPKVQVFATDIDEAAIGTARAGRYPSTLLQGMSSERLSRYFVHGIDGSYTVAKSVRELCTWRWCVMATRKASRILAEVHEAAQDLHNAGAIDELTMRRFDALCLPPVHHYTAADVKRLRKRYHVSQAVLAAMLNVGKATVASWEREKGGHEPSGPALKLLDLVDRKGLAALA